jgi:malonyl-CoA O-methyltransferase
MRLNRKEKIEKSFGDKAGSYERYATLQKESAQKLATFLPQTMPGKILEIGCGTGFLTEQLQRRYPQAHILCVDLARDMVLACQQKFTGYRNLSFQVGDGENLLLSETFDLIASNLTVQWFDDPKQGLKNLSKNLTKDGHLFYTTIGQRSFGQWKRTLEILDLPSGILESPEYDGIFSEEEITYQYDNALHFLRTLKKIGAQSPRAEYKQLSTAQLQKACKTYDNTYHGAMDWHILYGCLDTSGCAGFGHS